MADKDNIQLDEVALRRMIKCARRPQGHTFSHDDETNTDVCSNCGLTIQGDK
jgi:hypothetical protein